MTREPSRRDFVLRSLGATAGFLLRRGDAWVPQEPAAGEELQLWYAGPAREWVEALPAERIVFRA